MTQTSHETFFTFLFDQVIAESFNTWKESTRITFDLYHFALFRNVICIKSLQLSTPARLTITILYLYVGAWHQTLTEHMTQSAKPLGILNFTSPS